MSRVLRTCAAVVVRIAALIFQAIAFAEHGIGGGVQQRRGPAVVSYPAAGFYGAQLAIADGRLLRPVALAWLGVGETERRVYLHCRRALRLSG